MRLAQGTPNGVLAGWRHVNFDELFHDVYPSLYRYCLRLTADRDLAEDATQEAFVRLLDQSVRGLGRGSSRSPPT